MNSTIKTKPDFKNPLQQKAKENIVKSKPYVTNNSNNDEWYTPEEYIEMAREVLQHIDLDPASCAYANKTIKADRYFSIDDDGLQHTWNGKIWMNPPYGSKLIKEFAKKFVVEYRDGHIQEGIVLVNNSTDSKWFRGLAKEASAIVFVTGRINFNSSFRESKRPLQGQAFLYFGKHNDSFLKVFSHIGIPCLLADPNNGTA